MNTFQAEVAVEKMIVTTAHDFKMSATPVSAVSPSLASTQQFVKTDTTSKVVKMGAVPKSNYI